MLSPLLRRWSARRDAPEAAQPVDELLASELGSRPRAKVAVLGAAAAGRLAEVLRREHPAARVVVVDPAVGRSRMHVKLSLRGPFHLLVDLAAGEPIVQVSRFLDVFMHLVRDGAYLTPTVQGEVDPAADLSDCPRAGDPYLRGLHLDTLLETAKRTELDATAPLTRRDLAWLGAVSGDVVRVGEALLVRCTRRMQPKLRDSEINPILRRQPELGQLLQTRPGGTFASRCDYADSSGMDPADTFVDRNRYPSFDVPKLFLRRYDRPVCGRGQIVESRGLLLPDTFRHHRRPRMYSMYVHDAGELFGAAKLPLHNPIELQGAYFYFDSEWPGHYGHTMTEQISRWWAFEQVRAVEPDVKLLFSLPKARTDQRPQPWEQELFATQGLRPEDAVVMDAAVRPERLYAATPMFSCPDYVHPDITEVWDRISAALPAAPPVRSRRIFCTRPVSLKRSCRNTAEVENYFTDRGFAIVQPESYSLAEQIALFRHADTIAGFTGSGLFTLAFCETPKTVLMISPESYTARNEYMFAAVRGHRLRVAWSKPDIEHPPGRWTAEAFGSSFVVDFGREGRFLDQVLADT